MHNSVQLPGELVEFYTKLKEIQREFIESCGFNVEKTGQRDEGYKIPLIQILKPVFHRERVFSSFKQNALLVSDFRPSLKPQVETILQSPEALIYEFIETAFYGNPENFDNTLINNFQINHDILKFIIRNSVKPFLRAYAVHVSGELNRNEWSQSCCPVCGGMPGIARLERESRQRYLRCSMCDAEWLYKRMLCHNCGNEDYRSLAFLIVEESPGCRIDVCEVCRHYLKVIDQKEAPGFDLDTYELNTIFLDIVAQQRGYFNETSAV